MKIDTEYATLADVPQSVAQFYEEEVRTRVVGHTEPDDEGYAEPITEPYTVVVLNKPDTVLYSEVAKRIGERKSRDVVNAELARAIEWEEFYYNHDLVLEHEADYAQWEQEQPTELVGEEEVLLPAPEVPIIDMAVRREYYFELASPHDHNLFIVTGLTTEFDDVAYEAYITATLEDRPAAEVAVYHSDLAITTRVEAVYAVLPTNKGDIDVGVGKDGIFGIENVKDTLSAHNTGLMDITEVQWIMADNSVATLTINDLNQIIADFNIRKQGVFAQYGQWRAGDRLTPFTITNHQQG